MFTVEQIAKVCHEANRAYCQSLGDDSQRPWEEAPEWQKRSAVDGVVFHLKNPGAPDSASHDNWMDEKKRDGWKYGEVKDPEKKEHPCMVKFEHLPVEQQVKDSIFKNVIASFWPHFTLGRIEMPKD